MMSADAYGLPATTATAAALARYDDGVRDLLGWGRGALDAFREAAALDPGLALAHAGAAVCLFLEERFAPAREAAESARRSVYPDGEGAESRRDRRPSGREPTGPGRATDDGASLRADDAGRATRLLTERVARRPDHYWLHHGRAPAA